MKNYSLSGADIHTLINSYFSLERSHTGLGDCAIRLLTFEARKQVLSHVSDWTFPTREDWNGDAREELIVKIVELTPQEQYLDMLDLLSASNCLLLNQMWGDLWFSHLDRFIGAISEMALYREKNKPGYSLSDLKVVPLFRDGIGVDWNQTEYDLANCSVEFQYDYTFWSDEKIVLNPFDLVRIDVKDDFRFPKLGGAGQTLRSGQLFEVPAIWAYYILSKQNDIVNLTILRVLGDAAILLGSGGTATPFLVAVSGTDLVVACFENTVMSSAEYAHIQELFHIYDAMAITVYSVVGIGQLKWFQRIGTVNNYSQFAIRNDKLRELLIYTHSQIPKRDEIIRSLYLAIESVAIDAVQVANMPKLRDAFITALISLELTKKAPLIANAVIKNVQNDFIAIELLKPINGKQIGDVIPFAKVVKNDFNGFTYYLDDLNWYNPAVDGPYTSVIQLNNVPFKNPFDELVNSDFEVVLLGNGMARVVSGGGRFIAKSGTELKTHLDNLVSLPAGKTYNGQFYKSINTDFHPNPNPQLIDDYATLNLDHRYSKVGESGYYVSQTNTGNLTEMGFSNGVPTNYYRYRYDNVSINNMLDLSDDAVRQQLGITEEMIKKLGVGKYEYTHILGTWAKDRYKGIIYPGAQGGNYMNIIIFKQIDVDNALGSLIANRL